jgi:hypothetical protein
MNSHRNLFAISVSLLAAMSLQAQSSIDVTALGAHPDGSNAAATTQAFRTAFNSYSTARIIVPPGTYSIDNSQGSIYIPNFSGELDFEGGATLIFQSNLQGGLRFENGNGARIHGLHGNYAVPPTTRNGDEFSFMTMNDLTISDAIAQNSPGMGFLITLCARPKVRNVTVSHTNADGLAFANSQNAEIINYNAEYTADNGLAFYNYNYFTDWHGGTAKNIHIVQALGAHGIAVVGTADVVVSNFTIDTTSGSSVWVSQDSAYATRNATNVVFQHGVINNAGILAAPNTNNFGIEFTDADSVLFSDIQITGSQYRAVAGTSPNGRIRLHDIRVLNNLTGDAFVVGNVGLLEIANCSSENSPGQGFSFDGVNMLLARDLKVVNAASQSGLNRAIWFQNGNIVNASSLLVIDDRPNPAGYVVGASDNGAQIQFGNIQGVASAIANGNLVMNEYSPHISYSNIH